MTKPTTNPSMSPMNNPVNNQSGHHYGSGRHGANPEPGASLSCPGNNDYQRETPHGDACRYVQNGHAKMYAVTMVNTRGAV